jgi:hypothetical protein
MEPTHTIQQAHELLRSRFGPAWRAPYAEGKAEMATWLAEQLHVPHESASRAVEEIERQGMLRFEGATGRTASPPAHQKVGPAAQSPLTADVVVPDTEPRAPEIGTWYFD